MDWQANYHIGTNGVPGTKRAFSSMKDGTNGEIYNQYLIELGKQLDTYLTNMRDLVMGLVRPQASRVQELDDEGNALMAKALSNTNLGSLSDSVSMRQARMGKSGLDARNLSLGGVSGDRVDLEMPFFVAVERKYNVGQNYGCTYGFSCLSFRQYDDWSHSSLCKQRRWVWNGRSSVRNVDACVS
jgi:hypothetical protein